MKTIAMKLARMGQLLKKIRRYCSQRYQIYHMKRSGLIDDHDNHSGMNETSYPKEEFLFSPNFKSKIGKLLFRISKWGMRTFMKLIYKSNIELIRNSSYFDSDLYLNINPDIKNAGVDPAMHFLFHGWKEGRSPGTRFDLYFYLNTYPDVREMKINPLLHFLLFGEKEGRLPKPFEEDKSRYTQSAEIHNLKWPEGHNFQMKAAIVCHIYYMDMLESLWSAIQNMPIPFDLYLTTPEENAPVLEQFISDRQPVHHTHIVVCPNRGRDIAPFLNVYEKYLTPYEVVCKIHTKKSTHDLNLAGWGKHLTTQLLGHPSVIYRILYEFEKDASLGMVWPVVHQYIEKFNLHRGWGVFSDNMKQKARNIASYYNLDITQFPEDFAYPVGTMFWFRPEALRALLAKPATEIPFEDEKQQIDGTIAHIYESLFGRICEQAGFTHKTVYFDPELLRPGKIKDKIPKIIRRKILFISHDFVMAGAQKVLLEMVTWFNKHTAIEACVLGIQKGTDGGRFLNAFEDVADVYLWDNLANEFSVVVAARELIEKTGKIDLIYGNTLVAASLYPYFKDFGIPIITHVHELEHSIQTHIAPPTLQSALEDSALFIACSAPVKYNLLKNHVKDPDKVSLVHAFITPKPVKSAGKMEIRKALHLPENDLIVWGCGTICHRKGTDLFIQTAITLIKRLTVQNVSFIWIGDNLWDMDNRNETSWEEWLAKIKDAGLEDRILFVGVKENPRAWFEAGDVFYLPSREDPYPLVCLEAADCGLPIICFEDAGGMPDFVSDDGGFVVPFLDSDRAAHAMVTLIENKDLRIKKGRTIHQKLLDRHSTDKTLPAILNLCRKVLDIPHPVSVVIPVYNHGPYIRERIESILNQTFRDYEMIILDDASTDDGFTTIESYKDHTNISIMRNEYNSGSPFRQWEKGVQMSKGSWVWIAEGDDDAHPEFLERMLEKFHEDRIVFSYCASHVIDHQGEVIKDFYVLNGHYDRLPAPRNKWMRDYIENGITEIREGLAVRNTIPNVSAVLFRRASLQDLSWKQACEFRSAGDWYIYLELLQNGDISYISDPLNFHRKHETSVVATGKKQAADTLPDYFKIHRYVLQHLEVDEALFRMITESVSRDLRKIWPNLSDKEFEKLYDIEKLKLFFSSK